MLKDYSCKANLLFPYSETRNEVCDANGICEVVIALRDRGRTISVELRYRCNLIRVIKSFIIMVVLLTLLAIRNMFSCFW